MLAAHIVAYTVLVILIWYQYRRNYKNRLINCLLTHRVKQLSSINEYSSDFSYSSYASPATSAPQSPPTTRAPSPVMKFPSRCSTPPSQSMLPPPDPAVYRKMSASDLAHLRQTEWHH